MGRTGPHQDPQLSTSVGKVTIGATRVRIVRAETQVVPEHRQRTSKARTSLLLLVGANALRNARYAHRWSTFASPSKRIRETTTGRLAGTGICSRVAEQTTNVEEDLGDVFRSGSKRNEWFIGLDLRQFRAAFFHAEGGPM